LEESSTSSAPAASPLRRTSPGEHPRVRASPNAGNRLRGRPRARACDTRSPPCALDATARGRDLRLALWRTLGRESSEPRAGGSCGPQRRGVRRDAGGDAASGAGERLVMINGGFSKDGRRRRKWSGTSTRSRISSAPRTPRCPPDGEDHLILVATKIGEMAARHTPRRRRTSERDHGIDGSSTHPPEPESPSPATRAREVDARCVSESRSSPVGLRRSQDSALLAEPRRRLPPLLYRRGSLGAGG
jgi:hypothetical protein